MVTIKKISLIQFCNYDAAGFDFQSPITCITGLNGTGKTNLLDAVYYLCYTKSYFSAYQQNNVKHGTDGFRIEGVFSDELNQAIEVVSCKWKGGRKELMVDGVEYDKITDHIGRYAAVMVAPDDMELINDGSEGRRKWVDGILGQTDKQYLECLLQYQQVLLQRNAWLKAYVLKPSTSPAIELEFYNAKLSEYGLYIYARRKRFLGDFIGLLNDFYQRLTGGKEQISIIYRSDLHENDFLSLLEQGLQNDLRLQRTLKGIHKDDFEFGFNGFVLKQFGSQGQKKSYLFALKLAQFIYLKKQLNHTPILLLDDIFEKLDQERLECLMTIIQGVEFGQVLITDTHLERIANIFSEPGKMGHISL